MQLFTSHTKEEQATTLAQFLPNGRVFSKKFDGESNIFKFLSGFSWELKRVEDRMNKMALEHDITVTTDFITEWESAVGIPDDCFSGAGTLEDRRRDVLVKFAKMNVITNQDYIDLASLFGITVSIEAGGVAGIFPLSFPVMFYPTAKEARFTIVVTFPTSLAVFPLPFPVNFSSGIDEQIKCIFNAIRPANVQLLYFYEI